MPLKKHHKWIIGSSSFIILIFMITIGVFTYSIYIKQELNYNLLNIKITNLKIETQSNINSLSEGLIETRNELESQLGTVQEEFSLLQASAGEDFSGIIEDSITSVVTIKTDKSQGTGFIIDKEGYIITNYHVMQDAQEVTIITSDNDNHEVMGPVWYNLDFDIALLKISGTYNELRLGNSNNVQIGERVIAIGNPLGLEFSVTQGIVSGIHRRGTNELDAYIQTDAALNPGNSGGPLINQKGEIIGINNFKIRSAEGLGFALESNFIKQAVNNIYQEAYGEDLV